MTTASAPRGSGPPVAMEVAVPDTIGRVGAVPQAMISSFSLTRTGLASPAEAISAERTAKPSTLERSNGGTSIGATTSCASARPSASASRCGSPGTAFGNSAASNRATASSRDRIVRNWSWSIVTRCFGEGALVMQEPINPISIPQHIGIDRRARSMALGPAWHCQPCVGAGDRVEREVADRQRQPAALDPLQQHEFGDAHA